VRCKSLFKIHIDKTLIMVHRKIANIIYIFISRYE